VKENEPEEQTALRKIREETGLEAIILSGHTAKPIYYDFALDTHTIVK
jgi:ADP-ribose pyrophosphatase YjhB (NUDIX family)